MNFDDTPEEARFRAAARAWITANRIDFKSYKGERGGFELVRRWQALKQAAGWGCLHWPVEYGGRGAGAIETMIFSQEEERAGMAILSIANSITIGMAAATIMHCGDARQKERHLPRIARGEEIWCQLFSEPAAGSDLAGVKTRARRDGADWIVNGQKVWTSYAQFADWAILITRSDPQVAKHKGLTYFLLDMTSPGITVRPIRQAAGASDFNEVFLEDVRIPDANRVGAPGDGWRVAVTTLMNERSAISGIMPTNFDEAWAIARATPFEEGVALEHGAVRALLADWYVWHRGLKTYSLRLQSAISQGRTPGPEASVGKLMLAGRRQSFLSESVDLLDAAGGALEAGEPGGLHAAFLRVIGNRIEGGSDEILRNIIGERVLGLPAEPRVDKDLAFAQIPGGS